MDSHADLAILEWIETLPDTPIASLTMDESSSGIRTPSKGKRPLESPSPSSSRKTRNAVSGQTLQEPSTDITTPAPASPYAVPQPPAPPSVTFQLGQETAQGSLTGGQVTPRHRPSASGQTSRTTTPERSSKQRELRSDWFWLKQSIPKAIFVNSIEEDAMLDLPTGKVAQKLDVSTRRAVQKLIDTLVRAAARQEYEGGADLAKIAQGAERARHERWEESDWYEVTKQLLDDAIGDRLLESRSV